MGDAAEMCLIELVDFNEVYSKTGKATATKKAPVRRSRKKSTAAATDAKVVEEAPAAEAPKAEETPAAE